MRAKDREAHGTQGAALAWPNVPSPNLRMILKRGARFSPISNW